MDIITEITQDHRRFRGLIEKIKNENATLRAQRKAFKELWPLVDAHTKAEEKTLYAYGRKKRTLKKPTLEAWEEHEAAKTLLQKIKRTSHPDLWQARVKVFCEMVEHHLLEEEQEFLPAVRETLRQGESESLAAEFRELNPLDEVAWKEGVGKLLRLPTVRNFPPSTDAFLP